MKNHTLFAAALLLSFASGAVLGAVRPRLVRAPLGTLGLVAPRDDVVEIPSDGQPPHLNLGTCDQLTTQCADRSREALRAARDLAAAINTRFRQLASDRTTCDDVRRVAIALLDATDWLALQLQRHADHDGRCLGPRRPPLGFPDLPPLSFPSPPICVDSPEPTTAMRPLSASLP